MEAASSAHTEKVNVPDSSSATSTERDEVLCSAVAPAPSRLICAVHKVQDLLDDESLDDVQSSGTDGAYYRIHKIVGIMTEGKRVEYLVQWVGFGKAGRTWEPASIILADAPDAVRSFERRLHRACTTGTTKEGE